MNKQKKKKTKKNLRARASISGKKITRNKVSFFLALVERANVRDKFISGLWCV